MSLSELSVLPTHARSGASTRDKIGCGAVGRWLGLGGVALAMALSGCKDEPGIPHPVSSTDDGYCRKCHTGHANVPRVDHADKSGCTSCHKVTATGPYPSAVPHVGGEASTCALCHRDGTAGASVVKHLDEQDCYSCHDAAKRGAWPPNAMHEVVSAEHANCLSCHGQIDHASRPSCTSCHQAGSSN
jgi:hypothetical protein